MDITEEQVINWLDAKRKEHGLSHLSVHVGQTRFTGRTYSDFTAHTAGSCAARGTIAEAAKYAKIKEDDRLAILKAKNA